MVDFVGLAVVLILALVMAWLVSRAWGSKNAILKWAGVVLGGLLTLIFALVFIGAVLGTLKLNRNYNADHPVADLKVAGTPDQIARGAKLTKICGCHGPTLGGTNFFDPSKGAPP